ncbi:MAG: hypothetical protein HC901_02215 [Bdellovibrionaceae bacterium]|nr:hypothetical protein [Pseudobdellovibrionaceae bacterium]
MKLIRHIKTHLLDTLLLPYRLKHLEQHLIRMTWEAVRQDPRHQGGLSLMPHGAKIFSQSDEDGIIREIFKRIGVTNRVFVEFGAGDGYENNTHALLYDGWCGLWLEGSERCVENIRRHMQPLIRDGRLQIQQAFLTRENIDGLIAAHRKETEIDLLSVDIDGNDIHVFSSIQSVRARVVVMEYNAKFPPPIRYCMEYRGTHCWDGGDQFGASLQYLEEAMGRLGYFLVGCNLTGVNAFFVRKDLAGDRFQGPFTAERHYEPARYYARHMLSGHESSSRTLAEASGMVHR